MKRVVIFSLVFCFLFLISSSVHAQSIDLLWQGEVYTPPFYKGRALWSTQSRITLVAIPHGLGSATNLNFKWTKNGTVLGNINGIGKNKLSFLDSGISRPQTIKVEVLSSSQGGVLANTSAVVMPIPSIMAVYENNPLYGFMFHRDIGGVYELQEREVTFTIFPFFFNVLGRADNRLSYGWRTNNGGSETKNSVTYRTPDDTIGSSRVSAKVSSKEAITQNVNKSFLIQFGNQ